jgi:hypothetical protein
MKRAFRYRLYPSRKQKAKMLKVALGMRVFDCCGCRRILDRDTNAAQVVLKRGLAIAGLTAKVGQDMPKLKLVETRSLPLKSTGGVSQVDEAGTTCPKGAGSLRS